MNMHAMRGWKAAEIHRRKLSFEKFESTIRLICCPSSFEWGLLKSGRLTMIRKEWTGRLSGGQVLFTALWINQLAGHMGAIDHPFRLWGRPNCRSPFQAFSKVPLSSLNPKALSLIPGTYYTRFTVIKLINMFQFLLMNNEHPNQEYLGSLSRFFIERRTSILSCLWFYFCVTC